jgi:hypothetical protein
MLILEGVASFVVLWCLLCLVVATVGGWLVLSKTYRMAGPFSGRKWRFRRVIFRGFVSYFHTITVGASTEGLFLAVLLPLRFCHPPLLIPWNVVYKKSHSRLDLFNTSLQLGEPAKVHVSLNSRLVSQLEASIGNKIQSVQASIEAK